MSTIVRGKIRRLVIDRGFGFIVADDGRQIFFHCSKLAHGGGLVFTEALQGQAVEVELGQDDKGRLQAVQVWRAA